MKHVWGLKLFKRCVDIVKYAMTRLNRRVQPRRGCANKIDKGSFYIELEFFLVLLKNRFVFPPPSWLSLTELDGWKRKNKQKPSPFLLVRRSNNQLFGLKLQQNIPGVLTEGLNIEFLRLLEAGTFIYFSLKFFVKMRNLWVIRNFLFYKEDHMSLKQIKQVYTRFTDTLMQRYP